MELKIYNPADNVGFLQEIEWNYKEIKADISKSLEFYKGLVYTEEQIPTAKADRAKLNALAKALDDKRKEIKKKCLAPYETFESQVKDVLAVIKEPVELIDKQIKGFEEEKKQKKLIEVKELFAKLKIEGGAEVEFVTFKQIFEDKFLNASMSLKQVETVINNIFNSIKSNLKTISELEAYSFEATEIYKTTLNLNEALEKAKIMVDLAEKKRQKEQKEAEEAAKATEAVRDSTENKGQEQTETISASTPAEAPEGREVKRAWVGFEAYLSAEEAKELKAFFAINNIQFRRK